MGTLKQSPLFIESFARVQLVRTVFRCCSHSFWRTRRKVRLPGSRYPRSFLPAWLLSTRLCLLPAPFARQTPFTSLARPNSDCARYIRTMLVCFRLQVILV